MPAPLADQIHCYSEATVGNSAAGEMSFSFLLRVFRGRQVSNS